jgi:hypothetical protein
MELALEQKQRESNQVQLFKRHKTLKDSKNVLGRDSSSATTTHASTQKMHASTSIIHCQTFKDKAAFAHLYLKESLFGIT